MAVWARYSDGVEVSDTVFKTLAAAAPTGTLDVFASDQHSSYLKLLGSFFKHIGRERKATDDDVTEVCRLFAKALQGRSTACLFNHLAYKSPGFRDLLGKDVLLIGRLEDTQAEQVDGGRGQLARLAIEPEEAAPYVDGFKTLVKLDPDHRESWKRNREWLENVYRRSRELGKPLFNETLIFQRPGESKADSARRLPKALVAMARDFSPHGDFYKTQVPVIWSQEGDTVTPVSSPTEIRETAAAMAELCPRPMLLLSAAVDFSQYAAQYALVSDIFAGPMCGRAYFKEAFSDPSTRDWDSLGDNFQRRALPRIAQIQDLATVVSPAWWAKYEWMSDEAMKMIDTRATGLRESVRADFGY
jgi:tagatose-1,6-bisphosphate aldolase